MWKVLKIIKIDIFFRDSTIVSLADTGTSILAGVTIFAILGNLAYESGKPIESVVKSGTGLAFVSYPEAIANFEIVPQVYIFSRIKQIAILLLTEVCYLAFCRPFLLDVDNVGYW